MSPKKSETIKDRILKFISVEGISKNKFYTSTGISNGTLDKKSGLTSDSITKIHKAYPNISLAWLISGEGEMFKFEFALYNNLSNIKDLYVKVTNTAPEEVEETSMVGREIPLDYIPIFAYRESHQLEGYVSIPKVNTCDAAGYVKTDSMYPLINLGDIVCYKTASEDSPIFWGEMYIVYTVIDGHEFFSLKYINKSELGDEYVLLTSYNSKYQPREILLKDIIWKALVRAAVRYNTIL